MLAVIPKLMTKWGGLITDKVVIFGQQHLLQQF